jgi:tetratricopeptide (TPR) repeat protein
MAVLLSALILTLTIGCTRDPNVRKQKYFDSGNRYLADKKYREAAIQYQNALKSDPHFADAHYKLAQAEIALGNWNAVFAELRRTVEFAPQNLDAQADLGNLYVGQHMWNEAEQVAHTILKIQPNNPNGHSLLSIVAAARNDFPTAIAELKVALEGAPNRVDLLVNMGRLQAYVKNPVAAEQFLKQAVQKDPASTSARLAISGFYMQTGRPELAESNLQQAISLAPNASLYETYARFLTAKGRQQDAERVLADAKVKLKDDPASYRLLAEFYAATDNRDNAIAEYGQLLKLHPDDPVVWTSYVGLLLNARQMEQANNLIEAALKKNSKNLDALILKGQSLNMSGKYKDALEILGPAVKSSPENARAQLEFGDALSATGDGNRAESAWRQAAKLSPNLPAAQQRLVKIAISKGDAQLLRSAGESLTRLLPSSPQGYLALAVAASTQHNFKEAEDRIKQAISVSPSNPEGYSTMGDLLASQRKFDAATKMYDQALQKNPAFVEALVEEVKALSAQKTPASKIIARINAQIATSPNTDVYWVLLAEVQASTRDFTEATTSVKKALTINPKNRGALMARAELERATGDIDAAIATYEQMAQQNPTDPLPEIVIGGLEQERGHFAQAQKSFNKTLAERPGDPLASNNLAYLLLETNGDKDVALSLAQTARRALPGNPSIADTLGWALYQKGIYGSAREVLEEAVQKAPESAAAHYHLGMTYAKTSEKLKAAQHLKKALELAPNGRDASAIKQYLAENKG